MLDVRLVTDRLHGHFGWFATNSEIPAVVCARWYTTERDRRHSIELAIASIGRAELRAGARLMHPALMEGSPEPFPA